MCAGKAVERMGFCRAPVGGGQLTNFTLSGALEVLGLEDLGDALKAQSKDLLNVS